MRFSLLTAAKTINASTNIEMIETHGLSKKFGATSALSSLDLTVRPGEIVGFLGPNGSGKTTTVRILTGMLQPSSGSAHVAGFDVVTDPLEVKKRVGYVPETGALYETLSANEYLELVAKLHRIDDKVAKARIERFLELFGLLNDSSKRMSAFSKGMKQKVAISAALLSNPEVLLLDEPLDGLDATTALVIKDLLKELADQDRSILFCSHVLEVVERICTRIVIIKRGRLIAEGTAHEILANTDSDSLESAFAKLTGLRNTSTITHDILKAIE